MTKIAFIGDIDSIKGFSAVGLDIYPCNDFEEASKQLKSLSSGEYGIIYITEEFFDMLKKEISKYDEMITPAIIPIPGVKNNSGAGMKRLSKSVEMAVGSDIIFGQQ